MTGSNSDVVILAAGMGTRVSSVSQGMPKALLEVAGRTLLERALSFAAAISPHGRHIVVAGFQAERFRQHRASASNCSYVLVENDRYRDGSAYSVLAALELVSNDMYLLNADHIFPPNAYGQFISDQPNSISVFCDQSRKLGADDMKVQTHGGTRNVAQMSKLLMTYDYGYIGVTFVPRAKAAVYRAAADGAIKQFGQGANAESLIQCLANKGEAIHCVLADNIPWFEVDTPEDYEHAIRNLRD